MPPQDHEDPSTTRRLIGRVRQALGWATADRRAEAQGRMEQLGERQPDGADAGATALDAAELHVRNDHGDLAPSAQPADQPAPAVPNEGG